MWSTRRPVWPTTVERRLNGAFDRLDQDVRAFKRSTIYETFSFSETTYQETWWLDFFSVLAAAYLTTLC